ncbi:retrovirus-related pol polyprotein from transposon TNT 1-94 [Tanacetum coccineum]|uniref:Retrovirus-related pol polyprotein from transposon TNT 1-94 n=1 Tax=Tanacetum coccineum TaxID=301880 RepID=A0ABQ4Z4X8_9ASTR
MMIFSHSPDCLWAEVVLTACFTQNRSLIHSRYNKTPYELIHERKTNVQFFHVLGSLCYPTNDQDDLGKLKPATDIEHNAELDGNEFINSFSTLVFDEVESSSRNLDPSNMHMFYQPLPFEHQWTKAHPLDQVLGDPSKSIITRSKLSTDAKMYVYALTVSLLEPSNIKEALENHSWIEAM